MSYLPDNIISEFRRHVEGAISEIKQGDHDSARVAYSHAESDLSHLREGLMKRDIPSTYLAVAKKMSHQLDELLALTVEDKNTKTKLLATNLLRPDQATRGSA